MKYKKWNQLTAEEKLDILLDWCAKTHIALTEAIKVVNQITDFLYEREGEVIPQVRKSRKRIES